MIRLIAVAAFALVVTTSAQAMPRVPLQQPDGTITQAYYRHYGYGYRHYGYRHYGYRHYGYTWYRHYGYGYGYRPYGYYGYRHYGYRPYVYGPARRHARRVYRRHW